MATIRTQRIRAKITIKGLSPIETPDVLSFNVSRARGQMSASFSASLKVSHQDLSRLVDNTIEIEAGTVDSGLNKIFTGFIERTIVNPIRTDASKVMLNISGRDVLSILDGQKINRRVRTYKGGGGPPQRWGAVTGVLRHNTSRLERLATKINSNTTKAVQQLPQSTIDATPNLFRMDQNIDRIRDKNTFGAIEVTTVIQAKTSQEGG